MKKKAWEAADILRGSISSADYKDYILGGMLFLKRLSDVFEEEAERVERETGDHDLAWNDPDEHLYYLPPEGCLWKDIQKLTQKIGDSLNTITQKIEDQNPVMEKVLGNIDFNSYKLGDLKQRDTNLSALIRNFSAIPMRNADLESPDMLGDVYMYLIERFADDGGKKGGESSSRPIRSLLCWPGSSTRRRACAFTTRVAGRVAQ
ncbi:type I restriction-modification system subunit M N-terminal domain-containing protein [Methanoculleus chikugoensis]|uniref:type I restriction-modification system subunit M N-terminal domain-containing protein n=1 Tax=Methanoculleus chikugoensis TaxID=118126 RepID=UPI001FB50385|nr:type I restriction-modification system subunit M N-terminal domain-containing protein [Methanoculleus chikugoensis]